jgi:hypothetical protein
MCVDLHAKIVLLFNKLSLPPSCVHWPLCIGVLHSDEPDVVKESAVIRVCKCSVADSNDRSTQFFAQTLDAIEVLGIVLLDHAKENAIWMRSLGEQVKQCLWQPALAQRRNKHDN